MRVAPALTALVLTLAGCDDSVMVRLQTGARGFDVDADALALPDTMRDGDTIAQLACGPTEMCPSSADVPITCEASVCDPAARTISFALGEVVDVDQLTSDARELLGHVEAIEVVEASYDVPFNALTVPLPETELFWGPEGASHVDASLGVVALGVVPPIEAGAITSGAIALDAEGVDALSRYLVDTSRRVRFFARTRVDLAPGDAFPEGTARIGIDLHLEITGSLR
ncbi:hypothetical protein [Sandaracinus amylolyticus]|uniref:hypothetical protein n=1 Tax=Sandaracinus amylolyticus TaxID=927083 RepID=UPI001F2F6441|nr:hypothetical protein [Sandaracinus amylolyticus]UJR82620.1 Hypothetical protein I5071_46850 [Sandaracinus amylolyticus]